MTRSLAFLALALCCAVAATASRTPMDLLETPWASMTQAFSGRSHDSDAGIVTFKMFVPPGMAGEFVDKWDSYIGAQASKAKGNIMVALSRPIISNAVHYDYSEWETMEDFACFFKSKDARDFQDYLADKDIKWEIDFLAKSAGSSEAVKGKGRKSHDFQVLSTIVVKPHHAENFISAFMDAEEETSHENSNLAYNLHRVVTTNDKFYLYGAWTSEQAWKDHLDSNHVQKLANWADDHDVVFIESPLNRLSQY